MLSESGDTSLTCGPGLVEGGYDEGRPIAMGAWLQLDVLETNWERQTYSCCNDLI